MSSVEKGQTVKILREKQVVSPTVKDNLKQFNKKKKAILEKLQKEDLTIAQLSEKTQIPRDEMLFLLMTLVKYGYAQTGIVDDMDEYFNYKIKRND